MTTTELPPPPTLSPVRADEVRISPDTIARFFRRNGRLIAKITAASTVVGIVHALLAPVEYTTQVRLMPELQSSLAAGVSQFNSLAGLAGINLDRMAGGDAEAVRPDLYPNILQSTPFLLFVMEQKITDPESGRTLTVEQYLTEKKRATLTGRLQESLSGWTDSAPSDPQRVATVKALQGVVAMDRKREKLAESLQKRIQADLDKKTGIISIYVVMPNPVVAAAVARLTTGYLTRYVIGYRTGKASQQADFLQERVSAARRRYESAEYALRNYRDRNRNLFLNVAQMEGQRLQADFTLAQQVYNELARQLEQAKIKVQEETPVFKELEPPQVPNLRSEPKRTQLVLVYGLLGAVLGTVAAVLRRRPWQPQVRVRTR